MAPSTLEAENHERDAAFNKVLHGKSSQARGGFAAMMQKDKKAQAAAVDEYFKHWDNKASAEETEETREVSDDAPICSRLYVQVLLTGQLKWNIGPQS